MDKTITISPYSMASYYVDVFFNDIKLSNATCFFTKRKDTLYLVTNWHVVSGRNADSKICLDKMGSVPNKLRVYVPREGENSTVSYDDDFYMDIDLLDQEGNKLWYEMQKDDRMVDVVVVPLHEVKGAYITIEDAEEPYNEQVYFEIASEIYIIGFPFGKQTGYIPIWKKASVASEPELDVEDLPYFFADTATKSGMSGSPVILYKDRPVVLMSESEKKFSRHWTKLVGIYSGRIGADSETKGDAQLGRVWKPHIIQELIDSHES
ncbi:TPA: trypsin-like peptidase domain-containing protein [Clostridioides difficile]|uniref:Serine protease n=3 Tax=Bacillota TaxID=1239 RepID=A0A076YXW7_STRAG|nr:MULTISPECIES: serine protease [Bacillota]ATU30159.1 serine protease [Enterococcus faecium]MBF9852444.1 trypsin-like peptidase domain-containing protein [Clostridioides difficile]AIK22003.1 hypothetical protein [Streptococcus anginosus]AIK71175.1 hypothetical protein DK41_03385 [Streptococcus agalactiae]AIK77472.1 hypothetical protein DK43_03745 [Streptococcus anginosus]